MDPLKIYDYLETTRGRVFDRVRSLSEEQYGREFPIGLGSLARILTHIMISEYYYVERIMEREVPPYDQWPIHDEAPPAFAELEAAWKAQSAATRAALGTERDWDAEIEYRVDPDDTDPDDAVPQIVTTSVGDLFTQLMLHETHHRSQAMNILRHLGTPADDLDYNSFFARRAAPA
ncbi:MAG: DinB family protein [Planctomycetota bacterium]|jgi:uncharacterized damage-inducible protein DinB